MKNGYNYDALTNTLTISSTFAKKASKVGSPEYNLILKLRRDYTDLTIQQEEKKAGKKGLTYDQMKVFLSLHRNGKELLAQFERIYLLSKVQPMPYMYVKDWFEKRFPYYSEQPILDEENYVVPPTNEVGASKITGVSIEGRDASEKAAA